MKNLIALGCVAGLALTTARASFQPSYATVNGAFYDLNASTMNPDFHLADLGVFDLSMGDTFLLGGELNVTGSGNIAFANLGWGVYDTSNESIAVAFSETPATFNSVVFGNDRWLLQGGDRPNVLSTLGVGNYRIHIYLHGDYTDQPDFYESNGGTDYRATFTVIPEPSSLLLGALAGLAALLALRRRKG